MQRDERIATGSPRASQLTRVSRESDDGSRAEGGQRRSSPCWSPRILVLDQKMVELCELRMLPDGDDWPADIDSRIAALNFGGDSVLFESFDPSVSTDSLDSQQLRERCQPRKDDFQLAFADSGHWQSGVVIGEQPPTSPGSLTTWGRIRTSTEPPFDERTASEPDMTRRATSNSLRPNSLIANFVGDTRFVDVNDNEINGVLTTTETAAIRKDRWRRSTARSSVTATARRTFADLNATKMAPELEFLALHHEMPTLCESSSAFSLSDIGGIKPKVDLATPAALPSITSPGDLNFPDFLQDDSPDSGLGCSGPTHIEDWASLSILLPKHVAEACSFFKSNSQLLTSSNNCIDRSRRSTEACRTCYRVRRRIHPPLWAQTNASRTVLCDCVGVSASASVSQTPSSTAHPRHSLRPKELSIVGLPIYASKRTLVEQVVEGVAALSRGDGCHALLCAMRNLVEDGLKEGVSPWTMIKTVTSRGPATKNVHAIVKQLDGCEQSEKYRVDLFFEELIRENSLDCWLCYVVLKENVLKKLYDEQAFLAAASSEYRTLLWRMVDSLSLLPVLEARENSSTIQTKSMQKWGGASRIASDSRVPKSSSVPARLSNQQFRPSRIPLPKRQALPSRSRTPSAGLAKSYVALVVEDHADDENFALTTGEKVRVFSERADLVRCTRVHGVHSLVNTGLVPRAKIRAIPRI
ncbi:unnamed protein product [Caenorhabditis auriculariae]|uniref:RUN domain-containing protein n=1 Tax=Caenorhabditis auriculariae TaxID=2777116 RepID=A0A8S1GNL5_9PELO|nr:unnamed protein product [Caenorhabditis auriculariae]